MFGSVSDVQNLSGACLWVLERALLGGLPGVVEMGNLPTRIKEPRKVQLVDAAARSRTATEAGSPLAWLLADSVSSKLCSN